MNLDHLKEWINKFQTTRQHTHTQQQGLQAFLLDLETSKHFVQQYLHLLQALPNLFKIPSVVVSFISVWSSSHSCTLLLAKAIYVGDDVRCGALMWCLYLWMCYS